MLLRRILLGLAVAIGVVFVAVGIGILTTWELTFVRLSTFDHDFTGLVCGSPLNNPGWETGMPCHGAVNRQAGLGLIVTSLGFTLVVGSFVLALIERRRTGRASTT